MGTVYEVADRLEGDRRVALKTMDPRADIPGVEDFFRHEFSALARLRHPNVVTVHDYGVVEGTGRCFFTMDLVEGQDLFQATRGLGWPEVHPLVVQVCRGLEYIHARGYVHHDIKPENILVSRGADGAPVARLMDFGLAGSAASRLFPDLRGTPQYMAPELFRGQRADPRTDLYALGVVLFLVVTGRLPFEAGSASEVIRMHLETPPPSPMTVGAPCPAPLAPVLLRLLAKSPSDRHRTANELVEDLDRRFGTDYPLETHETRSGWIQTGDYVGREDERALLAGAFEAAARGASRAEALPRLVLVEGEAGLGKTRLFRELRHQVQTSRVAWCHGDAGTTAGTAWGAPVQALRQAAAVLPGPGEDGGLWGRHGGELVRLLPELAESHGLTPSPELDAKADRTRLRDGVAGFLVEAARLRPLVICLEDLHEGDVATAELLSDVARRLAEDGSAAAPSRLLVCASWRPEEAPAELARAAEEVLASGEGRRLRLAPLSAEQVAALVRSMLPVEDWEAALAAKVAAEAGGNPCFVEALMSAVAEGGCLVHREGRWRLDRARLESLAVPRTLERAMAERLAGLGLGARGLAALLSVVGEPAGYLFLLGASGLAPAEMVRHLAELERRRMVSLDPAGGLRLSHPLLREVAYAEVPGAERRRMHAEVLARLLAARGGEPTSQTDPDVEALARHALEADDGPRAVRLASLAAGRCLGLHQTARTLHLARAALERLGRGPAAERVDLLLVVAAAHHHAGQVPPALDACREAEAHARALGDRGLEGRSRLLLSSVLSTAGRLEEAANEARGAREAFDAAGERTRSAEALREEGRVDHLRGRYPEALHSLREAEGRLRPLGDRRATAYTLMDLGKTYTLMDRFEEALACHLEARAVFDEVGDRVGCATILGNLAVIHEAMGRMEEAMAVCREATEGLRAVGHMRAVAVTVEHLGRFYLHLCDPEAALTHLRESLAILRRIGDRPTQASVHLEAGQAQAMAGHPEGALAHLEECLAIVREVGHLHGQAITLRTLGLLHLELGDPGRALAMLEEASRIAPSAASPQVEAASRVELAQVYLELGDPGQAALELEAARGAMAGAPSAEFTVALARAEGELALARGEGGRALGLLREAVRAADASGDVGLSISARTRLGEAQLETGRTGEVASTLQELEALARRAPGPTRPATLLLRGLFQRRAGLPERAALTLQEAAALARGGEREHPGPLIRSLHELCSLHREAGRPARARECCLEALEVMRRVSERVPPERRGAWLAAPARVRLRADAEALLGDEASGVTR
ncbi:MAG: tetratricopeptide repeat protein [Planctomycetes bacterium]|nr:tetratricopeptide repeat protein [Planctomycetota bacterium]